MTITLTRDFLFWCAVINYGLLIFWAVLFITARKLLHNLCSRVYGISPEQNDAIQFAGVVFHKVAIWMLFIVPYIALRIMG